MATINFGIDLGTTNSLIARFNRGHIEVFKNPVGFKETLPSVVAFRNDRIMVGDSARVYAEKDARSVVSRFKRKMGTAETFKVKSINSSRTPTELSAFVLKELKNFVHSGEAVEAAVITIPASFDTLQSNATKEAGKLAGFKHVLLLQEPIAASLAYANRTGAQDLRNSQWIVYDFGGGTFDVALVKIIEGELTVVDHEGDNYLGGTDFDALIVERLIVPALQARGHFEDLLTQLRSDSGRYATLYPVLLQKAEEAKVELSTKTSAEIDLGMVRNLEDDDGKSIDAMISITRSEYEALIKEAVDATAAMLKKILTRNSLQPSDLKFVLMVGGTTYTPFVRKRIEELLGIPVNTDIDPTNAIAVGAAYFAGTREIAQAQAAAMAGSSARNLKLKVTYNRNSQDAEETFAAKAEGNLTGLSYRIQRDDGAYDSGLKTLTARISEDLPLRAGAYNVFSFKVTDEHGTSVATGFDTISIAQGRYSVAGQMLPEDLSLVKDDVVKNDTRLECVFTRNTVLPAKTTRTVEIAKSVMKGSTDEIHIIVVEGPADHHSTTNKPLGILRIGGAQLSKDLLRGTEVDLSFTMSESRDLSVSAYLNGTGQEFSQVFDPKARAVPVDLLTTQLMELEARVEAEQDEARKDGKNQLVASLEKLQERTQELMSQAAKLPADDVTDDRFKLEDKKREVAQAVFTLTAAKRLEAARKEYRESRKAVATLVADHGNDRERHRLSDVLAAEGAFIDSTHPERIEAAIAELDALRYGILFRQPEFQVAMFEQMVKSQPSMNDPVQARQLIEAGKSHIRQERFGELAEVVGLLLDLLPDRERAVAQSRLHTGIM